MWTGRCLQKNAKRLRTLPASLKPTDTIFAIRNKMHDNVGEARILVEVPEVELRLSASLLLTSIDAAELQTRDCKRAAAYSSLFCAPQPAAAATSFRAPPSPFRFPLVDA